MAADADAIAIAYAHLNDLVDRGLSAGDQLLDVMIVRGFAWSDDGHRWVIEDRVTGQQQEEVRIAADRRKAIRLSP